MIWILLALLRLSSLKKLSNFLDAVGIFLANSRPILVKNFFNSFAMSVSFVTRLLDEIRCLKLNLHLCNILTLRSIQ